MDIETPSHKSHFVYILRCGDGTLYTGYTTELLRRIAEHNAGKGAKYTRGRTPVELVYVEEGESRSWGLRREESIKHLSRIDKENLIAGRQAHNGASCRER
ncbi:GIY-YIG nuclease family protein [Brevibacillus humidisoli]|uniref:GIY-YIG nuclease family protein n=1 Tax=Brevibacillus humidisoli TaxID=2895522 RepID=UPI001E4AFC8B|nr:GIY-YIG nuclease family protein [Brevibacillus humidisoli]UFJ40523.1 GIY-YIG nuclease family protein [Brevibacillus humidisoli]